MKCWYDGLLQLSKGELVKIIAGHIEPWQGYDLRVTVLDVVTTGRHYSSWFSSKVLPKPIMGRVIASEVTDDTVGNTTTYFEIEEGNYED
jgi:hypothetical protein